TPDSPSKSTCQFLGLRRPIPFFVRTSSTACIPQRIKQLNLATLRRTHYPSKFICSHQCASFINGHVTGDEEKFGRLNSTYMGVLAEGLGEGFWVEIALLWWDRRL